MIHVRTIPGRATALSRVCGFVRGECINDPAAHLSRVGHAPRLFHCLDPIPVLAHYKSLYEDVSDTIETVVNTC